MPKQITRVLWEASNVPSGLSFDTATGTFSGTPDVEGEYTVPVSVETNYGRDSKDVVISIKYDHVWEKISAFSDDTIIKQRTPIMRRVRTASMTTGTPYLVAVSTVWYKQ